MTHAAIVHLLIDDSGSGAENFRVFPVIGESIFEVDGLASVHSTRLTLTSFGQPLGWLHNGFSLVLGRITVVGRMSSTMETGIILSVISRWTRGWHQHILK